MAEVGGAFSYIKSDIGLYHSGEYIGFAFVEGLTNEHYYEFKVEA